MKKTKGKKESGRRRVERPVDWIPFNTITAGGRVPGRIQSIAPKPGAAVGAATGAEVKAVRIHYSGISVVKTILFITNQERDEIIKKYKQETGIDKIEVIQGGKCEIIKI